MLSVLQKLGRAPFAPPWPVGDRDSPTVIVAAFPVRRLHQAALQFAFYAGAPGAGQENFRMMVWTAGMPAILGAGTKEVRPNCD